MAWKIYCLTYELQSPLHIGYHKIGNVQRTRYYVPARNLWAACTESLTRSGFYCDEVPQGDYREIGKWVGEHCAFTYFFPVSENGLLSPNYTRAGLRYGQLPEPEFERRFVSAHVTTALEPTTTSAADASLHEVEFIAPNDKSGSCTTLRGYAFLDKHGLRGLGGEEWYLRFRELQVGGERRYGFGQLRLAVEPTVVESVEGYAVTSEDNRPIISVGADEPLLAHTPVPSVNARGLLEPLVGRETSSSAEFGQKLTKGQICWAPGSVCRSAQRFTIAVNGTWEVIRD